ncbi:sterol carrier family protein [soil metagenome]
MPKARIPAVDGVAAIEARLAGADDRDSLATASRYLLQLLEDVAPGNTLEVRVPPFGAAQVVEGPRHTRGTPPNVIEMDAATWIALGTGSLTWHAALAEHRVAASGQRADLRDYLPIAWAPPPPE